MRKGIIAIVTLFTLTVQTPQPARAGAFATEITQLLNHAQLIMQYLRQAEQLAEAVKQTADMLKNSKILPGQVFGPISSDLNALASIVQGGQALSYSLANLDSQFKARFPGYGYTGTGYFTQYRSWSQTSLDTTLGALRAAGLQGQQLQSEQSVLTSLAIDGSDQRRQNGGPSGDGADLRTAGSAVDETAGTDDGRHVEQTELSGSNDSETGGGRSRDRKVFQVDAGGV